MVHALNAGTGTMQPGVWSADSRMANLEQQAIGLPNDDVPFDNDDDPATTPSKDNLSISVTNSSAAVRAERI